MDSNVKKMYEGYWSSKEGLESFKSYERNESLVGLFKSGEKVLDLGCGEGVVSEYIQLQGSEVIGFDISKEALKKAEQRGIKTVLGDVEKKLHFKDEIFDVVFWGDNIEHLFLPAETLKEIKRILKPKGRVIISCPNMGYWRYRIFYLLNGMMPQTEWYGAHPWEWEHIRFFNKLIMQQLLAMNGFSNKKFMGVSRRKLDRLFLPLKPDLFGMIMIVEAIKK